MIESTSRENIKRISREYQENENFALKQDKRDCPMTAEYTKANRFKDIVCKIYI